MYSVADLHCDTVSALLALRRAGQKADLRRGPGLSASLEKLRAGGVMLQNFALFVDLKKTDDPLREVLALADLYHAEIAANRDIIRPAYTVEDLEENRAAGLLSAVMTVEEGAVCRGEPAVLRTLFRLGARAMTLTWNYPNELAAPNGKPGGLTETGRAFVEEMERLGMLADVSHLGDDGFWEMCRIAKKPFFASHSSCRALYGHPRNLTDEMLRALADRGGAAGVNFYAPFLGEPPETRTADIVRHIRHIITVAGIDTPALGSDFDGIDCTLEMGDAAGFPALIRAMEQDGFTPREIEAVCRDNALRLYREVFPRRASAG